MPAPAKPTRLPRVTPGSSFARPLILSGADVVLPDRVLSPGTVIVEDGRVTEIETGARPAGSAAGGGFVDLHGHILVAGFIDVHVHGVEGFDSARLGGCGRGDRPCGWSATA